MKKYVITISREFGCGAREIAGKIARQLDIPLYDKELVDLVADKIGVHSDVISNSDEIVVKKRISSLFNEFGYGSSTEFYSENAIEAQESVILGLANTKRPCVIFGRCADYILREHPNVFRIFLYAPMRYRVRHIATDYSLDELGASKLINRVDKQRHNYYKYVTGFNRGNREYKDMQLDVSLFGVDGCVRMVTDAVNYLYNND